VLLTHMFGHPAPARAIAEICRARELPLFEDCAHAVGTRCGADGRAAGRFGDGALFSFGIFKIVNALGGGMLALPREGGLPVPPRPWARPGALTGAWDPLERLGTSLLLRPGAYTALFDPLLRRSPALLRRLHPSHPDPAYRFDPHGRQLFERPVRLLCQGQLARLEAGIERRRAIVARIHQAVAGREDLRPLTPDRHGRANGSYLSLWCADPEGAVRALDAHGVDASAREFTDCAGLPGFAPWARDCPVAALAHRHTLRLPSFPCLGEDDLERMVDALEAWRA
jgi:dTDP-4-amino-4,6-dideoxygalactose transaminase